MKTFASLTANESQDSHIEKYNVNRFGSSELSLRCSVKKVVLKISQNSQESTCARVSFQIKLQT